MNIPTPVPPATKIVDGATYWVGPTGELIPESLVKPIDRARDEMAREIVSAALDLQQKVADFRLRTIDDIEAFIELSAERYGVTPRGIREGGKGNITLFSFDGKYKIVRKNNDLLRFGEELQAAKILIDQCLHEWCAGSRDEIRALVNDAFQVDKTGGINTGRVLTLRRLDIQDETWQRAMQAIADATVRIGTATYLMIYERVGTADDWKLISVDLAAAGRGQ